MFKALSATILALSLTACSFFNTDKVYSSPQGSITISTKACTSEVVKQGAPDELKAKLKDAKVEPAGMPAIKGCWLDAAEVPDAGFPPGFIFIIADNGGYALFPKSEFK